MSAFNHFADTSSGGGHLQRAEQEEVCSDGDLGAPSPAPGVGTGALVQSREKRWHTHFPELRVTPALATHSSLSGDMTHPSLTQLADAPDSTEHPGFQRKEGPTRLTRSTASTGAHKEVALSALPQHPHMRSHRGTSSPSAVAGGQASSGIG